MDQVWTEERNVQLKSGRRNLSPPDDVEEMEDWMMSYGDLMTLLLCFFLIFFAEFKRQADSTLMLQIGKRFHEIHETQEESMEEQRTKAQMLSDIESEMRNELNVVDLKGLDMGIHRERKEVLLRLNENDFFHIGSYNLKPKGRLVLNKIAELLNPFQEKVIIKVEGHSDSLPVNPFSAYHTNLNLSSLRASYAANVLIDNKILESRLRVVGFGSARQLVPDRQPASEEGQVGDYIPENGLKNRRIEIRIQISDSDTDKAIDLAF